MWHFQRGRQVGECSPFLAICLMVTSYRDRFDAGRKLAPLLSRYAGNNTLVLALPRGGIPVGYEVARALHAPLDVILVRKLGVPGQEELAMGAIASGGLRVISEDVVEALGIPDRSIAEVAANEEHELQRQERAYRGDRPLPEIQSRTVILIDDGLATGATMRAAVLVLQTQQPGQVIVAVPFAPRETCEALRTEADEVICALTPESFMAVGEAYQNFSQVSDEEVRELLHRSAQEIGSLPGVG
jgi:putative phosphoribosyl transferase